MSCDIRVTYRLRTAWTDINRAGTLKVSKNISAAFSRFLRGFNGASVSNTGCWRHKDKTKWRIFTQLYGFSFLFYLTRGLYELCQYNSTTKSNNQPFSGNTKDIRPWLVKRGTGPAKTVEFLLKSIKYLFRLVKVECISWSLQTWQVFYLLWESM